MIMQVEPLDSAGRTSALQDAMAINDPKPIRMKGDNKMYAQWISNEHAVYPKVMFRLALKNSKPAGDPIYSDPIPLDMAEYLELEGSRLGNAFVAKHPYITRLCGVIRPDQTVDWDASKAQEAEMVKAGWRDSLSKIVGLPKKSTFEEEYDALPPEMLEQPVEAKPAPKSKGSLSERT